MILCWAPKPGAGTSVVTAGVAAATRGTAVDLCGDQMVIAGVGGDPEGIGEWFAAGEDVAVDGLRRLTHDAGRYRVVPRGTGPIDHPGRIEVLARLLEAVGGVVVDAGDGSSPLAHALACRAGHRLMVVRACYLAARRAQRIEGPRGGAGRDALVVVTEPGRALGAEDMSHAIGLPLAARVRWDPSVSRSVDAGLFAGRPPRHLVRCLGDAVSRLDDRP